MIVSSNEKAVLKAIIKQLEGRNNSAAYTPVRTDDLNVCIGKKLLNETLNSMAGKRLLLVCGEYVVLSDTGTNAYDMPAWMDKKKDR